MDVDGLKIALLQKIIACKDEALLKKIEALLQNIKIEVNEPHEDYEVEKHKSLLSEEQLKELERRSKAYESGEEKAIPWEEVKKDIEKNMDYSIKIYPSAQTDLNNTINYYKNKQFGLEKRFLSDFEKTLNRIQSNPYIFRLENKYRNALLDIFPYLVIFEINDQEIIVLAVFNTHLNPTKKP